MRTRRTPRDRAGRNGGRLRTGNPGNRGGRKGRSGRPPKRFKSFISELRQDPEVQNELARVLRDADSRHYPAALRVLVAYDDELPMNMTSEERVTRINELLQLAEERHLASTG